MIYWLIIILYVVWLKKSRECLNYNNNYGICYSALWKSSTDHGVQERTTFQSGPHSFCLDGHSMRVARDDASVIKLCRRQTIVVSITYISQACAYNIWAKFIIFSLFVVYIQGGNQTVLFGGAIQVVCNPLRKFWYVLHSIILMGQTLKFVDYNTVRI